MVADKFEVLFHRYSSQPEGVVARDRPFAKNRQYTSAMPDLAS
jgi:hypothetical protein